MEQKLWKTVYRASGMVNARIVTGRLETEGIPTKLEYEAVGTIYGLTLDGLGEVRVMVPEECLGQALDVLSRSYEDDEIDEKL